jgi:hypothetical protein
MALNYIGTVTWGNGDAGTKVISNIPQNFDDLLFLFWVKSTSSNNWWDIYFRLNQDSSNHRHQLVYRDPNNVLQPLFETDQIVRHSAGSGNQAWGQAFVHVQNYTSSDPKTYFGEEASDIWVAHKFGAYFGGAVTSFSAVPVSGIALVAGSKIDVYGIKYNQNTLTATQS